MVADERVAVLTDGAAIVGRVLEPHGFVFVLGGEGKGSGGPFAWGSFSKDEQRIELHVQYSLGLVFYTWNGVTLAHGDYLRGLKSHG